MSFRNNLQAKVLLKTWYNFLKNIWWRCTLDLFMKIFSAHFHSFHTVSMPRCSFSFCDQEEISRIFQIVSTDQISFLCPWRFLCILYYPDACMLLSIDPSKLMICLYIPQNYKIPKHWETFIFDEMAQQSLSQSFVKTQLWGAKLLFTLFQS